MEAVEMTRFKDAVRSRDEVIVTCECVPGRGSKGKSIEATIEFARQAVSTGLPVHAISITCNLGGNPAISPDVLAVEVQATGLEALMHSSWVLRYFEWATQ
jgi:hypothetical protein